MDIEAWKFLKKGQKRHSEEYYNILENKCISVFRCDPINNENEESNNGSTPNTDVFLRRFTP